MEITSLGSDPFVSDVDGLKQVESTLTFTGARTDNGQRICCTASNVAGVQLMSGTKLLDVKYAPSSPPAIRGYANGSTYSMIENSTESLTCSSKGGKPLATLTWKCFNNQMSDPTEQDHTVTRVVQWTARRYENARCTCIASHMMIPDQLQSAFVNVNILYPPSTPLFRVANVHVGSSIKIVRDSTQTVECYSSGNPAPTSSNFTWRRGSTAFGRSPVLKWPGGVKVVDEGSYTCTVETTLTPTNQSKDAKVTASSSPLEITVLYPPGLPTIHLDSSSGPVIDGPLTLVVQRPFTLACNAFSKPPGSYTWTGGVNVVQGQLIQDTLTTKVNTSRMCTASSRLNPSVGEASTRTSSAYVTININYPPESVNIRHESVSGTIINSELRVIEGDATKLYCSVQSQPASSYSWSGVGIHSLGNTMVYSNTRPKQTGVLSCLVENNMTHLIQAVKGLASRNISLNVLYPPKLRVLHRLNSVEGSTLLVQYNTSISIFDFIAFPNQYIVTIKESDRLVLLCGVFSNPNSTIRLKQKHMATIIMERENVREVVYVIQNVSCSDAAVYTCSAFNNYTDVERAPSKELQLLVECSPRPSDSHAYLTRNATGSVHRNVTFAFMAVAYPPPMFEWQMWNGTSYNKVYGDKYVITSSDLLTTLTILNIQVDDFGSYILNVSNGIQPNLRELFYLNPQDVPQCPINFTLLSKSTTMATVQWNGGFNGGLQQTFVLVYKKRFEAKYFTLSKLEDKATYLYNLKLTDLEEGQLYDVLLFSLNSIGSCKENISLEVETDTKIRTPNQAAVIGGLVSGSIVVVIVVIVLVFILRQKYTLNCSCDMSLSRKKDANSGQNCHGADNSGYNAAVTYEVVSAPKESPIYDSLKDGKDGPENLHVYMQLKESNQKSLACYENVNKEEPVYQNTVLKTPVQTVI
ncbi:hemicentin-1-like [Mya arenaria]|uniref:hemicentin-1-like n=1 Tax=Mya arenaria TaxID=6604 RepID=UPI0022E4AFEC|nr:hemicentin-1-like [Mya arenaria]